MKRRGTVKRISGGTVVVIVMATASFFSWEMFSRLKSVGGINPATAAIAAILIAVTTGRGLWIVIDRSRW